jgi:hypothetical protein
MAPVACIAFCINWWWFKVQLIWALFWQVIIVTSSLMKDMNSKTDLYRANAIRVLCRITEGGLLGQIERYLKQAVVDKNPVVSSAALVSGIHLLQVIFFGNTLTTICQVQCAVVISIFFLCTHLWLSPACGRADQCRHCEAMEQWGARGSSVKGTSGPVSCFGSPASGSPMASLCHFPHVCKFRFRLLGC